MTDDVIEKVARAIAAASGTRIWVRAEGEAALAALVAGDEVGSDRRGKLLIGYDYEWLPDINEVHAAEAMREACAKYVIEHPAMEPDQLAYALRKLEI